MQHSKKKRTLEATGKTTLDALGQAPLATSARPSEEGKEEDIPDGKKTRTTWDDITRLEQIQSVEDLPEVATDSTTGLLYVIPKEAQVAPSSESSQQ